MVLGPGSWFTSVLPHLMVPSLRQALVETHGHLVVVLNLAPQDGETEGYAAADHLAVLLDHAPDLPLGTVLVDRSGTVGGTAELDELAAKCGARSSSPTSPTTTGTPPRPGEARHGVRRDPGRSRRFLSPRFAGRCLSEGC